MATQYVASNDTIIETLANHAFKDYGKELGNYVVGKHFGLAYLKKKSKVMVVGALDFTETLITSENSNFAMRSHYTEIPAAVQDPTKILSFEPMTLSGTLVINQKHKAQVKGKAEIRSLLKTLQTQADTTVDNIMSTQCWDTSPTSGIDPDSIPSTVSATPTTGTYGGVSRVTNTWARNKVYATAITDIGSEAGLAALHAQRIQLGGAIGDNPDFAITTPTNFGGLYGYMDTLRRLRADEQMAKLGFDQLYVGTMLVGFDAKCASGYLYMLNSNHLFLKILEQDGGSGGFVFEPFSRKDNSLNSTSIFYVMWNLTSNQPDTMLVCTSVSTS